MVTKTIEQLKRKMGQKGLKALSRAEQVLWKKLIRDLSGSKGGKQQPLLSAEPLGGSRAVGYEDPRDQLAEASFRVDPELASIHSALKLINRYNEIKYVGLVYDPFDSRYFSVGTPRAEVFPPKMAYAHIKEVQTITMDATNKYIVINFGELLGGSNTGGISDCLFDTATPGLPGRGFICTGGDSTTSGWNQVLTDNHANTLAAEAGTMLNLVAGGIRMKQTAHGDSGSNVRIRVIRNMSLPVAVQTEADILGVLLDDTYISGYCTRTEAAEVNFRPIGFNNRLYAPDKHSSAQIEESPYGTPMCQLVVLEFMGDGSTNASISLDIVSSKHYEYVASTNWAPFVTAKSANGDSQMVREGLKQVHAQPDVKNFGISAADSLKLDKATADPRFNAGDFVGSLATAFLGPAGGALATLGKTVAESFF